MKRYDEKNPSVSPKVKREVAQRVPTKKRLKRQKISCNLDFLGKRSHEPLA